MMRLQATGLESGAAAARRLKKREEREMGSILRMDPTASASDREGEDDGDYSDAGSISGGSSASPSALHATPSSSSSVWHPHPSDAEMSSSNNGLSATWRDVVISNDPPHGVNSMAAPPPTTSSKRKKTKKEVFVCHEPNCGKQFPRSFALRRHMRIHTGTKPYACDFDGCTQRFNTSGNLSRHKRIHSGERPYPCIFSTCGKKFNTSTKLKRHMRIHFPEGQNVFRCIGLNCGWSCDNYKEFAAHQKLQHNIIVGAGLEAASAAAAAAAAVSAAANHVDPADDDRSDQYDPAHDQDYGSTSSSSTAYLYGYGKQHSLPPPPSVGSQSRKHSSSSNSSSSMQYYDSGFNSLGGLAREIKKGQEMDHLYGEQHRRGKSSAGGYALPPSFPSADAAAHYAPRSSSLTSIYDSAPTLAISSESSSYGHSQSSHRSGVFGHSLRHEEPSYKSENDGQYDHQPHPHASPAHHHILRPPPPSHHDHQDTMKFPVPPPMNPAAPEFTGEELSVVLELMKDSYY